MFNISNRKLFKFLAVGAALFLVVVFLVYRIGIPSVRVPGETDLPPITDDNTIHFSEAPESVGEELWVFGVIDHVFVSTNNNYFLNFCSDFRECPFSAPVFSRDVYKFKDMELWAGREVHIYGTISLYEGRPQIIVNDSKQVVFLSGEEVNDRTGEIEVDIDGGEIAEVINVTDGDTIWASIGGLTESIRLIGIDAPELEGPYSTEECYGREAKDRLDEVLEERTVILKGNKDVSDRDHYGRLLRYIYLPDETLVNALMIEEGYAFFYGLESFSLSGHFLELERQAREARKGLWSDECDYFFVR